MNSSRFSALNNLCSEKLPVTSFTRGTRWRLFILTGCLLAVTLGSGGCSSFMSQEDRDFYGRGWLHPSDMDRISPADQHRAQTMETSNGDPNSIHRAPDTDIGF